MFEKVLVSMAIGANFQTDAEMVTQIDVETKPFYSDLSF